MSFQDVQARYRALVTRLQRGEIDRQTFQQAVAELRFRGPDGRWWTIDPNSGSWLVWSNNAWVPAQPSTAGAPRPTAGGKPEVRATETLRQTLSTKDFLREAKEKPLAQRSQRWWDAASIFGGIISAFVWFVYSSIRGRYEGYDLITPAIMIALPISLTIFRKPLDKFLLPLQKHKAKIPKIVLIGAGIAAPLLVSWILYSIFRLRQYPYLRWSLILGTLSSYVVVRTPTLQTQAAQLGEMSA